MMTGSDGVSFLFPQLFLSQQRLVEKQTQQNKTCHNLYLLEDQETTTLRTYSALPAMLAAHTKYTQFGHVVCSAGLRTT